MSLIGEIARLPQLKISAKAEPQGGQEKAESSLN